MARLTILTLHEFKIMPVFYVLGTLKCNVLYEFLITTKFSQSSYHYLHKYFLVDVMDNKLVICNKMENFSIYHLFYQLLVVYNVSFKNYIGVDFKYNEYLIRVFDYIILYYLILFSVKTFVSIFWNF